MRLIDADEAVRAVHDEFDECLVWDESGETTANEFENIILQIPTVDAVEVVRCKDCRWFENDGYHTNCQIMRFCVEAKVYCCRAERRGEQDG